MRGKPVKGHRALDTRPFTLPAVNRFGEPTPSVFDPPASGRSHEFRRSQHDRAARTPVSERGLVPRENTAFLGAARDSGIALGEVA